MQPRLNGHAAGAPAPIVASGERTVIWPAVLAAALGLVLLAGAGFVWADLLDDGALAGRIYFALPCH